ncbi:hypothetical protein [Saliterribacillus persicus]|uniref:LSM domain-containing protein n=1 Tax=Saliterribacillus persicus TaxID=930114 RepID=A0A368Y9Y0_9BACI|nr:hypothetical protein [Saliterribacillus persicus]RCW76925.1 hypothetical protein DFR57_102200 [Saliterribacillus persicus]
MNHENYGHQQYPQNLHDTCEQLKYYHVTVSLKDGTTFDGIIENVDAENVIILVGEDVMDREDNTPDQSRQVFNPYGGGGYGPYGGGGYGPYGYPPRRVRRYRRRNFPLGALAALTLLPFIAPLAYNNPYPYY